MTRSYSSQYEMGVFIEVIQNTYNTFPPYHYHYLHLLAGVTTVSTIRILFLKKKSPSI